MSSSKHNNAKRSPEKAKQSKLTPLGEKIRFAEKYIRNKEGVRWSLKGREWIRDEFWRPADGWKLWRYADKDPCDDCADKIGEIIEHPADNPTVGCECGGLAAEPILVTILNLERGDGKTFNLMAYSIATLYKARRKSISCLWASEDQGTRIFDENWRACVEQSPELCNPKRAEIYGTPPVLDVHATKSKLDVLSSSHRSVTGARRTHLLLDEARDIKAQTAMALLPSINAMHGTECPAGHVQLTPEDLAGMTRLPKTCSACGRRLVPWWPRVVIVSAAGTLRGNETDWLCELIEELQANPHKNYHLFVSSQWGRDLNPRKSGVVTGAITDVFGKLPSTKHYVSAEFGNQWTQPGDDIMTPADIKRVTDVELRNEDDGTKNRAVGFLDTSVTVEKTSLVILAEDPEISTVPWEHVYLSYLEFWWPGHGTCKSWRQIKEDVVQRAVETVLPLYPNLTRLAIDTKTGAKRDPEYMWPVIMLRDLRRGGSEKWRKKVEAWRGGGVGSDEGWDFFIARVVDQTIRLQPSKEIIEEVKGITLKRPRQHDGPARVVDRNRTNMHKDILESLACLCWLIKREQHRSRRQRYGRDADGVEAKRVLRGGTPMRRLRDDTNWI